MEEGSLRQDDSHGSGVGVVGRFKANVLGCARVSNGQVNNTEGIPSEIRLSRCVNSLCQFVNFKHLYSKGSMHR